MKGKSLAAVAAVFMLSATGMSQVQAGVYTDDLSKCLVRATTDQQKATLVQWIFGIAALHPTVKPLSSVTDSQRTQLNKDVAALFMTLLTDSCRKETQDAVKYEGPAAIQASFGVLGQVAMTSLFSNQDVNTGLGAFAQYLDKAKLDAVLKPTPASKP